MLKLVLSLCILARKLKQCHLNPCVAGALDLLGKVKSWLVYNSLHKELQVVLFSLVVYFLIDVMSVSTGPQCMVCFNKTRLWKVVEDRS